MAMISTSQETCSGYDFENRLKLKIDIAMKKIEERATTELVTVQGNFST